MHYSDHCCETPLWSLRLALTGAGIGTEVWSATHTNAHQTINPHRAAIHLLGESVQQQICSRLLNSLGKATNMLPDASMFFLASVDVLPGESMLFELSSSIYAYQRINASPTATDMFPDESMLNSGCQHEFELLA
jgi:hypothetical protein